MSGGTRLKIPAFYLLLVGIPLLAIAGILRAGRHLPPAPAPAVPPGVVIPSPTGGIDFRGIPDVTLLLMQVAVILVAARLLGWLFRKLRQPQVVGEMAAGILLGPSLLGWTLPRVSAALFPPSSLGSLNALCQIGLVLFMFLVGLELDTSLLQGRGSLAVLTSHASISAPFVLGCAAALLLYPGLAGPSVPFPSFALFLGAAMSVTAFPVLARILTDRGLARSSFGTVSLACAAVDDVTAWCILAGLVALTRASGPAALIARTLAGLLVFVVAMLTVGRAVFRRFAETYHRRGNLPPDSLAMILLCVLASALASDWLGVHAIFGAFLVGTAMPRDRAFVRALAEKLQDLAVILLLPLFFAFTGLRTRVSLISSPGLWQIAALLLSVAVVGKLGGSAAAARACRMPWREALAVGTLLNTRGLMELVILNVGLDLGVISPVLFAILVLVALATTAMTSPLLDVILRPLPNGDGA